MRRLLLVLVLAAGCGSTTTKTTTVTAPAVTRTTHQTPGECRAMGRKLVAALKQTVGAALGYSQLILPAYKAGVYGTSVGGILTKEDRQTKKVGTATALVTQATALTDRCFE